MSRRDRERRAASSAAALPESAPALLAGMAADEPPSPPTVDAIATPAETAAVLTEPAPATTLYRVHGPGSVAVGSRVYPPGKIVRLSPAEAASVAAHVTPVA